MQFTVGAGDIPAAVLDQVAPGGRLVIPMRIRGSISRSFAFERDGGGPAWTAVSCEMATFVPMRKSAGDDARTSIPMAGDGNVVLETHAEQDIDRDALRTVLDAPASKAHTGVKFRQGDPWEWVYLWLACVLPSGLSRMPGSRPGFTPHFGWGSMAALDGGTLAYLTVREGDDADGRFWEIGVTGHGPRAASLTQDVAGAIREWNRDHGNQAPAPGFRMAPAAHRDLLKAADPGSSSTSQPAAWSSTGRRRSTRDEHRNRRPHPARLLPQATRSAAGRTRHPPHRASQAAGRCGSGHRDQVARTCGGEDIKR